MFTLSTTPMPIFKVWRNALNLYKNVFTKILGFIIVIIVFNIIFQPEIYQLKFMTKLQAANKTIQTSHASIVTTWLQQMPRDELIALVILTAIMALIWLYVIGTMLHRIYNLTKNPQSTFKESSNVVLKNYFKILIASIIVLALTLAGLTAFIIPGVFFAVMLTFTLPFILFDGIGIFKSLWESCKLVWGNWWRTFVVIFIPLGIITIVFNYIIRFLIHSAKLPIFADVVDAIIVSLLFSVLQTFIIVQFNDLKLRKAEKASKKAQVQPSA